MTFWTLWNKRKKCTRNTLKKWTKFLDLMMRVTMTSIWKMKSTTKGSCCWPKMNRPKSKNSEGNKLNRVSQNNLKRNWERQWMNRMSDSEWKEFITTFDLLFLYSIQFMAFSTDLIYLSDFIAASSIVWLRLMLVSYAFHCLSGLFSCGWVRDHKRKTKRLSVIDELHGLRTSVRKETPIRPEPNWTEPHLNQFKSERSMLKMSHNPWFAKFQSEHCKMQIQIKLPATGGTYFDS